MENNKRHLLPHRQYYLSKLLFIVQKLEKGKDCCYRAIEALL